MPRPPTGEYWVERIRELDAGDPKMSASAIARELDRLYAGLEQTHELPPSENTIRRIRTRISETERALFRSASWPESFGTSLLPESAAPSFFELWRHLGSRPSVRLTNAFHRVRTATEGLAFSTDVRHTLAIHLMNGNLRNVELVIKSGQASSMDWISWQSRGRRWDTPTEVALAIDQEEWGELSAAAAEHFSKSHDALLRGDDDEMNRVTEQASPEVREEIMRRIMNKYGERGE